MSRYVPTGASAAGGIGTIIVCADQNLDRKVAIKFLQSGCDHGRLLDELTALQRIRSKHVVQIFDVDRFDPGSRMGIVEEFIDGNDIEALLGTVTIEKGFLRPLYQAATGIADIHAVGIVHRDIKPSNMLIDQEGILKIIDFNLSRAKEDAHTVGFRGTRGYAAPELYVSGEVEFDASIDVYALGITAWALLYGQTLPMDLMAKPPRPEQWKAKTGGFAALPMDVELARLLDACLAPAPADRPSASQVSSRAARLLLKNKHRALFLGAAKPFNLDSSNRRVTLTAPRGTLAIEYDGLDFRATAVAGEVWGNNIALSPGSVLAGCSVIAFGGPNLRASDRVFVTMDVSHPEVVL